VTNRPILYPGMLANGAGSQAPLHGPMRAASLLRAAGLSDGSFVLCGIAAALDVLVQLPLPVAAHAARQQSPNPSRCLCTAPPEFRAGESTAVGPDNGHTATLPRGGHFLGHGAFLPNGSRCNTTGTRTKCHGGRIGSWDAPCIVLRVMNFASARRSLMISNAAGGGDTLSFCEWVDESRIPSSGRAQRLNILTMRRPHLYQRRPISEQVELPRNAPQFDPASGCRSDGQVRWHAGQGRPDAPRFCGLHRKGLRRCCWSRRGQATLIPAAIRAF